MPSLIVNDLYQPQGHQKNKDLCHWQILTWMVEILQQCSVPTWICTIQAEVFHVLCSLCDTGHQSHSPNSCQICFRPPSMDNPLKHTNLMSSIIPQHTMQFIQHLQKHLSFFIFLKMEPQYKFSVSKVIIKSSLTVHIKLIISIFCLFKE